MGTQSNVVNTIAESSDIVIPGPLDLGLPNKFSQWRPAQESAIRRIITDSGNQAYSMPTGAGKSPVYVGAALLAGDRVRILTTSKALQQQLLTDFASCGMVEIKGKSNYPCPNHGNCEVGQDSDCPNAKDPNGCPYRRALHIADSSQLVVTNYAWQCANAVAGTLARMNKPDVLVLDEAHAAMDAVTDALTVELTPADLSLLQELPTGTSTEGRAGMYAQWAMAQQPRIAAMANAIGANNTSKEAVKKKAHLRHLYRKMMVLRMATSDWVYYVNVPRGSDSRVFTVAPLWPMQAAVRLLAAPRVLAFSATLNRKCLALIGWDFPTYQYYEYGSTFDSYKSPIYWYKTALVKRGMKSDAEDKWVKAIDDINRLYSDRKGIIHPVSYDRSRVIESRCSTKPWLYIPSTGRYTAAVVERFRKADPPAVLLTPAVSTGWDFPGADCEYQIVAKVPYPGLDSYLTRERMGADPDWYANQTILSIVQMCGRGTRSDTDQCETLIIDNNIGRLVGRYRNYFPVWWRNRYSTKDRLPVPLKRHQPMNPIVSKPESAADDIDSDTGTITVSDTGTVPATVHDIDFDVDIPF
ncbi:MAG: DEAD/DEAH box helicase family protein [Anaerolineae bacterium]|nr:DEAD/DEAH box helicase family protein [Anaerolineae bacterium]